MAFKFVVALSTLLLLNPLLLCADDDHHRHDHYRFLSPVIDADFYDNGSPGLAKVRLGKHLFFDKILSGNKNISCATCHHVLTDTGDGLSLPIGEGARGLGVTRNTGRGVDVVHERVSRNAPPLFNLGARDFSIMFHDGRVSESAIAPSGFHSPAGIDLPWGLDNVLAVQAMFPVTSGTEMAGQLGENAQANASAIGNLAGPGGVWQQLAEKLQAIPGYVDLFMDAYDDVQQASDITYVHAANAIAAFEAVAWRADNSAFDRFLRGDRRAMSQSAKKGMKIFYGKAGCSKCHRGVFQTDQAFHAIAMPQIGPGKGDGVDGHEDFGRERVSGERGDRYKFRTPTLRNVALTGPWGHSGAFNTLEAIVRHHLDPEYSLENYDKTQTVLPSRADLDQIDFVVMNDSSRVEDIANTNELNAKHLSKKSFSQLIDFLHALTDPSSVDLRKNVPRSVPSGLSLAD